jgi:thiamine-monophosphate kinase
MMASKGEFGLIDWIRRHGPNVQSANRVAIGIGDDCAALRFSDGREVVVTTDMLLEGRHFRLGKALAELHNVGRKALGVNLSDIAAMAAVPLAAVVAVALPRSRAGRGAMEIAQEIQAGLVSLAEEFDVSLVGGDTNVWDGPLVLGVTAFGEATERGLLKRSGARSGDLVYVTGQLGGSLLGRHLRPRPRVREAMELHAGYEPTAMIDISDGLAADLGHILEESGGLGASLFTDRVPIHEDARAISVQSGRPALEHALNDGEDFELCFTVSPEAAARLRAMPPKYVLVSEVGVITGEPGLRLSMADGSTKPLLPKGFDHFLD